MVVRGAGLGRAKSWPATRGDLERRRQCVTRIGLDSRRVVRMYTCAQGAQQACVCLRTRVPVGPRRARTHGSFARASCAGPPCLAVRLQEGTGSWSRGANHAETARRSAVWSMASRREAIPDVAVRCGCDRRWLVKEGAASLSREDS